MPSVMQLFESNVWKAAFCVGAGYTIQNIGSGLASFSRFCLQRLAGINAEPSAAATAGDDGLPATTQDAAAGHGFGTRSMRRIVESHGGTLTLGTRGDVFTLNALFPIG